LGETFDRYGSSAGYYASPTGTPFEMRSLPAGDISKPLTNYTVIKPFTGYQSFTAPWNGQFGYGTQYMFKQSINGLLDGGLIK